MHPPAGHHRRHDLGVEVFPRVAVEYDVTKPDLVRVAGRSALDGTVPLLLDVLGTAKLIGARTFDYVPMLTGAAICYLILTLPTAFVVNALEKRYAR